MAGNQIEVLKLLRRNNYVVEVHHTKDGCKTIFPERRAYPQCNAFEVRYILNSKCNHVKVTTVCKKKNEGSLTLIGPPYAHKALVMFHIFKMCNQIQYNHSLLQFFIGNKQVGEDILLKAITYIDLAIEELTKEEDLLSLLIPAFNNGFQPEFAKMAESQNIADGYRAVAKMFMKGNDDKKT